MSKKLLPVTIISGFLGSGKTTQPKNPLIIVTGNKFLDILNSCKQVYIFF